MIYDFQHFPVLETERLCLRQLRLTDDEAVMAIRGDYEVTKYNIGNPYTHLRQAQDHIENITADFTGFVTLYWGITLKPADTVIGMIGYNYWNRTDHRASVGFDLARAHWGRGIMPEALGAVIRFGFEQMQLNRIEADASIYNQQSIRVIQKAGFRQEGHQHEQYYQDGAYHDLLVFALLKRDVDNRDSFPVS